MNKLKISEKLAKKIQKLREQKKNEWDGLCHGCQERIFQYEVARIGPYWICDKCIDKHFKNDKYSVNQAASILERIRGFN